MKKKRQSTVEPVFGTLTQFMGLRKMNTKGMRQANKVMLTSAVAYNIKKYLKFTEKLSKSLANQCQKTATSLIEHLWLHINSFKSFKITKPAY
jgi:hypothetical protein